MPTPYLLSLLCLKSNSVIYIVGDWVGPLGLLVDTSISSAKRAAEHILRTKKRIGEDDNNKAIIL
ncbi:MAG: hypothetical protein WBV72_14330 [Nitrososphaeraceae archaeon]